MDFQHRGNLEIFYSFQLSNVKKRSSLKNSDFKFIQNFWFLSAEKLLGFEFVSLIEL